MAIKAHLKILNKGALVWNKWRMEHPAITPDLSKQNIFKLGLGTANFRRIDFRSVNLTQTYLHVLDLSLSDFRNANLSETNFTSSNLSKADLRDATFK
ncbi:MAG: pentapeptide repeat-containing protein, partial [Deltaproteobacteria bacterium]